MVLALRRALAVGLHLLASGCGLAAAEEPAAVWQTPTPAMIDAEARRALAAAPAKGLAVAVIEEGQVIYAQSFGVRNAAQEPLGNDTVMVGASLTKPVFAYVVLQLAQEGLIDLDTLIAQYLPQPLPSYGAERGYPRWADLEGDDRWRKLTARMLLSHRGGFANFAFLEPDGKLRLHFEPGSRYAYSGEGLMLLQFVLERGLQLNVGAEVQRRVFDRFGMARTGMVWRDDFLPNVADGFTARGQARPHGRRSRVRAAGSMDTTLEDFARFAAGFMRGDGLTAAARADMIASQGPITTARQFPTLRAELSPSERRAGLGAGLGVVTFTGPQGPGFYKGGHEDQTGNTWVCLEQRRRCVVLLSNDVRAESVFADLVAFVLGPTGVPWDWEYGR